MLIFSGIIANIVITLGGFVKIAVENERRFSILETEMKYILAMKNKGESLIWTKNMYMELLVSF